MKIAFYLPFILTGIIGFQPESQDMRTVDTTPPIHATFSETFKLNPIEHATAAFTWDNKQFYIDPVGGAEKFTGLAKPDIVLITDIHGDHMDAKTLVQVITQGTKIIVPQAVADKLPAEMKSMLTVVANDQSVDIDGFKITGVPMYNLREEAKNFHTKGRGNGYVIEHDGMQVYFSGDTEDIPEMRNLKNIDKAFVCMNLPYTMTVEKAAEAVLDFAPKEVYPYHYRGGGGLSDVAAFKSMVNKGNSSIEVVQLNWYPAAK